MKGDCEAKGLSLLLNEIQTLDWRGTNGKRLHKNKGLRSEVQCLNCSSAWQEISDCYNYYYESLNPREQQLVGELKHSKNLFVFVILIYGLPLAICSINFAHGMSLGEMDYHQDFHCVLDLTPGTLSSFQSYTISKLTPFSSVFPEVREPDLPIVSFSIFKPPEITAGLLPL